MLQKIAVAVVAVSFFATIDFQLQTAQRSSLQDVAELQAQLRRMVEAGVDEKRSVQLGLSEQLRIAREEAAYGAVCSLMSFGFSPNM